MVSQAESLGIRESFPPGCAALVVDKDIAIHSSRPCRVHMGKHARVVPQTESMLSETPAPPLPGEKIHRFLSRRFNLTDR